VSAEPMSTGPMSAEPMSTGPMSAEPMSAGPMSTEPVSTEPVSTEPVSVEPVRVGVVGLGYWGPNLARNFHGLADAELAWCCDASERARERVAPLVPGARMTARLDDLLEDGSLDAVVLATPVPTHAELAVRVLEAGKHCFVEKPLAQSVADAEQAVLAAERAGRTLMVGHLLEYHPGIATLKQLADSGELGEIRYVYGNRLNLGKLRSDENALWSLGAHDVSVLLHLVQEEPNEVTARGESYVREGVEDVVFCFLRFPSGIAAHLHLSWLDPHKERRFTIVGSQRMATFDDMAMEGKLTVYDKGFDEDTRSYGEYITRSGDIYSPRIPNVEPLRMECEHFLESVRSGMAPRSDGHSGLRVVRVLEQLQNELMRTRRNMADLQSTRRDVAELASPPSTSA
jgi:predicted dehydrogenase